MPAWGAPPHPTPRPPSARSCPSRPQCLPAVFRLSAPPGESGSQPWVSLRENELEASWVLEGRRPAMEHRCGSQASRVLPESATCQLRGL